MSLVDTRTPDPKRLISGATGDWEIIIGLEVHAQVTSNSKLFSGRSTNSARPPIPMSASSMRRCPACCR
jgi:aspartyl-tRNA(Asn)/glutamyl-tRNA(Gln) amidotransferase subunit B